MRKHSASPDVALDDAPDASVRAADAAPPPVAVASRALAPKTPLASAIPRVGTKDMLMVLALAEYNSFIGAAAHLKTSQPIVTRAIKRLERLLGATLFVRSTRRVEITLAGRAFVAVAERALSDLELTVRSISEATHEQRGRITIATSSAFATQRLPELIRAFRETRAQVEVRVREGRQSDMIEDVRTGIADFGIGYIDSVPHTLDHRLLRREPLYALIPRAHCLAATKPPRLRLDALRDEPLVSLPSETYERRLLDGATAERGFALQHAVVVESLIGVISHVEAGVGIGVLPSGALPPQPWHAFHVAMLVEPSLLLSVGIITAQGRYVPRSTATMMSLVADGIEAPELWQAAK